jgi:acid phosphatase
MRRRDFLAILSVSTANALIAGRASAKLPIDALRTGNGFLSQSGKPSPRVRFIAFGDAGTGDGEQHKLARTMAAYHQQNPYDTAIMLGDNIYPDGNLVDVQAKFVRPYSELLSRGVKFHAVLGNHDIRRGRDNQVNYPNFNMGGRPYYSFSRGDGLVDFFAIDTNNFDGRQRQWLMTSLAASRANWKIAYFHHPIYSSGKKHGSNMRLRTDIEPLIVRYKVAAVFSGHDHTYERTKLQQGVQYFVSGAGGKLRRGDLNRRTLFFADGNDEAGSFMSIEITPERFRFSTIDVAGRVIDSGQLESLAATRTATLGKGYSP